MGDITEDDWGWANEETQEELIDDLFLNIDDLIDYRFTMLHRNEDGADILDTNVDNSIYYFGPTSEDIKQRNEIMVDWNEGGTYFEQTMSIRILKSGFKAEMSDNYWFFVDHDNAPIWEFVHPNMEERVMGLYEKVN